MRGECGDVTVAADATAVVVPTGLSRVKYGQGYVWNDTIHSCQPAYTLGDVTTAGAVTFRRIGCLDSAGTLTYMLLGH